MNTIILSLLTAVASLLVQVNQPGVPVALKLEAYQISTEVTNLVASSTLPTLSSTSVPDIATTTSTSTLPIQIQSTNNCPVSRKLGDPCLL